MHKARIDQLNKSAFLPLVFSGPDGSATIQSMLFVKAQCVTPGVLGDPRGIFLVELADVRWLAENPYFGATLIAQYNVRVPAGKQDYYKGSLKTGNPWKWQEMLDDMWNAMAIGELGVSPQLPLIPNPDFDPGQPEDPDTNPKYIPASPKLPPENFRFLGVNGWQAYNEVLTKMGCAVAFDPLTGGIGIVQMGATDTQLASAEQSYFRRRVSDAEVIEGTKAKLPASVTVLFHRQDKHYGTEQTTTHDTDQWSFNAIFQKTVANPNPSADSSSGASATLWDDLPVIKDFDGTILNDSDLIARANERAADFYRYAFTGGTMMRKTYIGFIGDIGFTPGEQVSGLAYYDVGGGRRTEIIRYPPMLKVGDDGQWACCDTAIDHLRTPDLGRKSFPIYPPHIQILRIVGPATEANLFEGTVVNIKPEDKTKRIQEKCWIYDMSESGVTFAAETLLRGRLNGYITATANSVTERRPLYLMMPPTMGLAFVRNDDQLPAAGQNGMFAGIIGKWDNPSKTVTATATTCLIYSPNNPPTLVPGWHMATYLSKSDGGVAIYGIDAGPRFCLPIQDDLCNPADLRLTWGSDVSINKHDPC